MKNFIFILILLTSNAFALEIKVYKENRRLELWDDQKMIKEYKIMLGLNPIGAKMEEGDNKTPEGEYTLDLVNPQSKYHYAFHISYPNTKQKIKALLHGKNPGSNIMIHGYPNQLSEINYWLTKMELLTESEEKVREMLAMNDWTNGCIALSNSDIDELKNMVSVPTKITIFP
jgi:murein L,D-transpeptidase YafK